MLYKPCLPFFILCFYVTLKAQEKSETPPRTQGYSRVDTQDQELQRGHEPEQNHTNAVVTERDSEKSKDLPGFKAAEKLSTSQLILRRGLILLLSVLILITGVAFQIAFPVPEHYTQNMTNIALNWVNYSTPTPLNVPNLTTSL